MLDGRARVVAAPPNLAGGELPVPESSRQAIERDQRIFDKVPVAFGDANVRLLTAPILKEGTNEVVGAVQVGESLTPLDNTMAAVERLLLITGIGALLLAVVVGWLFTRAALSPVARITATARHIAATGDYRQRLHVMPPRFGQGDELFFLASTFNDMIARLEHMLDSQKRLLADTSHELRNPITIIRGNLALLRRERVPEETRHEAVLEAEEEAARMGRLVGDLLLLARADAGEAPSLRHVPVDVAEIATEVIDQARQMAGNRELTMSSAGGCMVLGDRDRLKQLLANLVENAIRYTPGQGPDPRPRCRRAAPRRCATGNERCSFSYYTCSRHGPRNTPGHGLRLWDRHLASRSAAPVRALLSRRQGAFARARRFRAGPVNCSIHRPDARRRIEAFSEGSNRGSTFRVQLAT